MSQQKDFWRPFWIDVNRLLRHVDSKTEWEQTVRAHRDVSRLGVQYLLKTRQSSSGMFIFGYCSYHNGITLKEWAGKNGMDLHTEEDSSERSNVTNLFPRR